MPTNTFKCTKITAFHGNSIKNYPHMTFQASLFQKNIFPLPPALLILYPYFSSFTFQQTQNLNILPTELFCCNPNLNIYKRHSWRVDSEVESSSLAAFYNVEL